ncbi:MAG: Mu transposase C-terminal domain-containing protein [Nannocystis sp.]|nr:Mu transposase C-terminal domain-containing protein [Nannocystis sp.]
MSEDAAHHEEGLRRAIVAHGAPRTYYVDLGAAYVAASLKQICAELAIFLLHAGPGDAAARGDRALPQDLARRSRRRAAVLSAAARRAQPPPHRLDDLRVPQARPCRDRPEPPRSLPRGRRAPASCPSGHQHRRDLLHRERRTVRADGTIRWEGGFYEVPGEYVGEKVELRFAPLRPDLPAPASTSTACASPRSSRSTASPTTAAHAASCPARARPAPRPQGPLDYIDDEYQALLRAFGDGSIHHLTQRTSHDLARALRHAHRAAPPRRRGRELLRARPALSAARARLLLARHRAWPRSPHRRAWRRQIGPRSATSAAPSTPTSTASSTSPTARSSPSISPACSPPSSAYDPARAQIVADIKRALVTSSTSAGSSPVVVLDEARRTPRRAPPRAPRPL